MNDLGASIEVSQKPSLKKTFDASVGELNPQRLKKTMDYRDQLSLKIQKGKQIFLD
jgi:hypothetical protein